MTKRTRKELDLNSLEGRILFIFREKKDYEIGEILSCKRETVSGWRSGKSKPTLEHIKKVVASSKVDSDWIIEGTTTDIQAVTYAFFPVHIDKKSMPNPEAYNKARYFTGYALAWHIEQDTYNSAVKLSAAYFRFAKGLDLYDPESEIRNKYSEQPDQSVYLDSASSIEIPERFLINYEHDIQSMVHHINPSVTSDFLNNYNIDPELLKDNEYAGFQVITNYKYLYPPKKIKNNAIKQHINLNTIAPNNFCEIPYFPDGIAAGNPREMSDHPDGVVILHKDWCPHPGDTSAARLSDTAHSMEPTIMAGSIITVDHSITDPEVLDGEVVAIHKANDGCTIKRLKKIGTRWCGAPDNLDYDIIEIEEGDHIVGLVTTHHNRITNKR